MSALGMGGYGVYVWSAYGITALAILVEVLLLRGRIRAARAAARAAPCIDDEDEEKPSTRVGFKTAGGAR